jgi:hypothetical protein
LVNANEQDERTVEMTRELIQIFSKVQQQQQQQSTSGSTMRFNNNNDKKRKSVDWQSLDRQEVIALSRILIRKIFWDRRTNVLRSSNRILRQVLDLTAIRLETSEQISVEDRRRPSIGRRTTTTTAMRETRMKEKSSFSTNSENILDLDI